MRNYNTIFDTTVSHCYGLLCSSESLIVKFHKECTAQNVDLDAVRKRIDENAAAKLGLEGFVAMLTARPVRDKNRKLTAFKAQSEKSGSTVTMLGIFCHFLRHRWAKVSAWRDANDDPDLCHYSKLADLSSWELYVHKLSELAEVDLDVTLGRVIASFAAADHPEVHLVVLDPIRQATFGCSGQPSYAEWLAAARAKALEDTEAKLVLCKWLASCPCPITANDLRMFAAAASNRDELMDLTQIQSQIEEEVERLNVGGDSL